MHLTSPLFHAVVAVLSAALLPSAEIQVEPNKPADVQAGQAVPSKPAEQEPARAEGAESKGAVSNDKSREICGDMPLEPDLELGLDKTIPPVTFEEAMSMELAPLRWQRIRQINRLHQELEKRVKMSPEQKEILRTRVAQVYATMIKHATRSAWTGFNYPAWSDEEKSRLEGELKQAETNGDTAAAEKIRQRLLQGTPGVDQNSAAPIESNIVAVKTKMDPDQQEIFKQVVDHWVSVEVRIPMDVPTRMVMRSLRDPDLKLDPEFLQKAETKITDKVTSLPPPPERRQHLMKAAEELKAELFSELSPEKRQIAEATFASLLKEHELVEAYTKEALKKQADKRGKSRH